MYWSFICWHWWSLPRRPTWALLLWQPRLRCTNLFTNHLQGAECWEPRLTQTDFSLGNHGNGTDLNNLVVFLIKLYTISVCITLSQNYVQKKPQMIKIAAQPFYPNLLTDVLVVPKIIRHSFFKERKKVISSGDSNHWSERTAIAIHAPEFFLCYISTQFYSDTTSFVSCFVSKVPNSYKYSSVLTIYTQKKYPKNKYLFSFMYRDFFQRSKLRLIYTRVHGIYK